ncbi:MAG TPA: rhamnan synthesis F family protein, partial [Mycobacterium sp.]
HRLTDIPAVDVVERANKGFDIWGYKHGLDLIGWDELGRYDEVVLMNSTIAGPLYPLSEMFDAMDARDLDFWGLTMHAGEDYDPWDLLPTGKIERHIQSYFTAVRRRMLKSAEFHDYWDSLAPIGSYIEAVALHEAVFTYQFAEAGFQWASYIDSTDLEHLTSYPLMFLPAEVLIEKRCPFFKRKALFLGAGDLVATRATSTATMVECLDTLGYDLQRVLPSVIRTSHQSDVRLALNAFEVLASQSDASTADLSKVRVLAWVKDLASCFALERSRSVLEQCAELVIFVSRDAEDQLLDRLTGFKARTVSGKTFAEFVREVGRSAQTPDYLLVLGCAGDFSDLREISAYVQYETGLRALAGSSATLTSAIAHIASSTVAGALTSPLAGLVPRTQEEAWEAVAARVETLLALLGIHVPLSPEKPAWGPPSGAVLAGPGMLAADWNLVAETVSSLDEETAEALFTSIIPFILQSHGRLLVFALTDTMTAHAVFANQLQALQARSGVAAHEQRKHSIRVARVYHNTGDGYVEDKCMVVYPRRNGAGGVTYAWLAPPTVVSVRFDPVEAAGAICRGVTATVDGVAVDIVPVNCLRFGAALDVFMTPDPV